MRTYRISDYGAVPDGVSVCTAAIQHALDDCFAGGGGRVLVEGGTFVTGTLRIGSNTELHLAPGAVLLASSNTDDYPDTDYGFFDVRRCPRGSARAVLFIGQSRNVSISGTGTIDCRGSAFVEPYTDAHGTTRYRRTTDLVPGRMIFAMSCENLHFSDFTMREMAGGWGMWINDCTNVRVHGIRMECNPYYPNADGIHINCSSDVIVSDCVLHTGDDCVIIRSNCNTLRAPRVCERVIVRGCILSSQCQAVRIGWRGDYEIRDCALSDLVITDAWRGIVAELPDHSSPFDIGEHPTKIHDIRVQNVVIDRCCDRPVFVGVYPGNPYGGIYDLSFSGISCTSGQYPIVRGLPDAVLENIRFTDCEFRVAATRILSLVPFTHVRGLRLSNTSFTVTEESPQ